MLRLSYIYYHRVSCQASGVADPSALISSLTYYAVTNCQFGHLFEWSNDHQVVKARDWRSPSGLMEEDQDGQTVSLAGTETWGSGSILYDINGNTSTGLYYWLCCIFIVASLTLFITKNTLPPTVLGHNSVLNVGRVVQGQVWRDPCHRTLACEGLSAELQGFATWKSRNNEKQDWGSLEAERGSFSHRSLPVEFVYNCVCGVNGPLTSGMSRGQDPRFYCLFLAVLFH